MTKTPKKTTRRRKAASKGVAAARDARTTPAESVAFKEGRMARRSNTALAHNPHHKGQDRVDWASGWLAEQGGA